MSIVNSQETTAGAGIVEAARMLRGAAGRPARLVCVFGSIEGRTASLKVRYIVDVPGEGYRVLAEPVNGDGPIASIASITSIAPSAAWYERELQEMFGVRVLDHPDPRRLALHQNWPADCHPMLPAMVSGGQPIPWADGDYEFLQVEGEGVCEVAVGPVHAGIIEPGHFRFSVMGDNVLFLELRHFYTHKGTEKLFQGASLPHGTRLAESVSGDNCFAHAVAYCQAVEEAHRITAPPRAQALRLIGLELERMMAHIGDVGALSNDVAFTLPAAYCSRIKEDLLQTSSRVAGSRYWRGMAVPGGMTRDISPDGAKVLLQAVQQAAGDFAKMAAIVLDRPSVQSRFEAAGILAHDVARDLAVVGPVARSSGIDVDVRRDHPYGAYQGRQFEIPTLHYGDVSARAKIRIEEAAVSAKLISDVLSRLPGGPVRTGLPPEDAFEGFSAVESPRGELLYWVKGDGGAIARCYVKSPSFQNWPALPYAVIGNVIADFPLINKSFNLSYSGCDR